MSMFEAGAIGFRLQMLGMAVFGGDAKAAEKVVKALGAELDATSRKAKPAGEAIDGVGKSAKSAKAPLEDAAKASKGLGTEVEGAGKKSKAASPEVDKTAKSTKDLAKEAAEAERKVKAAAAEVARLKAESEKAARVIGVGAVTVGAAFATMAGVAVQRFSVFQEGMSQVGAATMATAEQQDQLGESALEAGAASVFSARESADAQTELAKAGVAVNDILGGGLTGSLALAAAGQLGVARAAEIAATTLTVFGLKGKDAGHVADLLAAGAGKAQGSVDDLALGLDYVGVTFARLNIPLEDTVGTLALLASNGLLGEKAGTGLRSVISSLTAPVAKGAEAMEKYGINVFDAQGKFIGMAGVAQQLKDGLFELDEAERSAALGAIFGAEAASAAGILYASGAEGVEKWTAEVDETGYAAEQARRMTDNLTGDIERLGGSFDSALIKTGSAANESLRGMVQTITNLIDWYASLDEGVQSTALWLGVGTAAALLLGGTFLLAVPKIVEFRAAMTSLNTTMKGTALAGGIIGVALTAAVLILGAFATSSANAAAKAAAYGDTLDETTKKVTNSTRDMIKANLALKGTFLGVETGADSAYDAAEKIGLSLDLVTDAAGGNADALSEVQKKLAEIQEMSGDEKEAAFGGNWVLAEASANKVSEAVRGEAISIEEAIRVARQKQGVDSDTGASSQTAVEAYNGEAEAVASLQSELTGLIDTINAANGIGQDAVTANAEYQQALSDVAEQVAAIKAGTEGYALGISDATQAGRDNLALLVDQTAQSQEAAEAQFALDGNTDAYLATLTGGRDAMIASAIALGATRDEAILLADKMYAIPTAREIKVLADTAAAKAALDDVIGRLTLLNGTTVRVAAGQGGGGGITEADGGKVNFYANGGRENHIAQFARAGTMRVWAEPETGGEWYIPASPAKRGRSEMLVGEIAREFGGTYIPAGGQAFANGGPAGYNATSTTTGGNTTIQVDVAITIPAGPDANAQAQLIGHRVAEIVGDLK